MASINGITVKALKNFRGHEGEPLCQGNIYLGNKKIGFWSQDAHGGCDNIYLDAPYKITKLEERVRELNRHKNRELSRGDGSKYTMEYSLDSLFGDWLDLKYDEDAFKEAVKNGYAGVLLVSDGYHVFGWNLSEDALKCTDALIIVRFAKKIEEGKKTNKFFKENEFTKHTVKIYRSLAQFNVGTHVKIEDIKGGK